LTSESPLSGKKNLGGKGKEKTLTAPQSRKRPKEGKGELNKQRTKRTLNYTLNLHWGEVQERGGNRKKGTKKEAKGGGRDRSATSLSLKYYIESNAPAKVAKGRGNHG